MHYQSTDFANPLHTTMAHTHTTMYTSIWACFLHFFYSPQGRRRNFRNGGAKSNSNAQVVCKTFGNRKLCPLMCVVTLHNECVQKIVESIQSLGHFSQLLQATQLARPVDSCHVVDIRQSYDSSHTYYFADWTLNWRSMRSKYCCTVPNVSRYNFHGLPFNQL